MSCSHIAALFSAFAVVVSASSASAQRAGPIHVASEAALAATPGTDATAVRDGYYVTGDAPSVPYAPVSAACTLNSGAGDGGAQVPTSNGGCWLANFAGMQPDPTIWGAEPAAGFIATISGTTMTVTAINGDAIVAGQPLHGGGVIGAPAVAAQLTGAAGGIGTYRLSASETVPIPETMYVGPDATTAVQAAVNALSGGVLYTGQHTFLLSSQITVASGMKLAGCHSSTHNQTCGFATTVTNLALFNLTANNIEVDELFIDNSPPGVSTSGALFTITGVIGGIDIHDGFYEQPCIGVDLAGVVNIVERNTFNDVAGGANCAAIRVGASTRGGATIDPKILHNTLGPKVGNPAQYAIEMLDAGGVHMEGNTTIGGFAYGTALVPGAGQHVKQGLFYGELGDTETRNCLWVNPASATGQVFYNNFVNVWAGACLQQNILIQNTSGGVVAGNWFFASRSSGAGTTGVEVDAGVSDFSWVGGIICANSEAVAGASPGMLFASGVSKIRVQNSVIGDTCGGLTGAAGTSAAITFGGATTDTDVSHNDFTSESNPATTVTGALPSDMPFTSHICGNIGYLVPWVSAWNGGCDPQAAVTLANSATQALPQGDGTVTITDLGLGQSASFLISGGNVAAGPNTGSTFVNSSTPTSGQIGFYWDGANYDIKMGSTAGASINASMALTRGTN